MGDISRMKDDFFYEFLKLEAYLHVQGCAEIKNIIEHKQSTLSSIIRYKPEEVLYLIIAQGTISSKDMQKDLFAVRFEYPALYNEACYIIENRESKWKLLKI